MMNEYCINGLTIKENLLRLAGEGNKKFTESLHPGIENVLGVRVPALRQLAAQIAKDDWQAAIGRYFLYGRTHASRHGDWMPENKRCGRISFIGFWIRTPYQ